MKTKLFTRHHQRYAVNLHILYRSLLFLVLMLFVSYAAEAKLNSDSGYVMVDVSDKDTKELIPFANVVAYQNGVQVAVGTTNMDGQFLFKNLVPGKYDVKAIYVGYLAQVIKDIEVGAGKTTSLYFKLDGRNGIVCYDITLLLLLFRLLQWLFRRKLVAKIMDTLPRSIQSLERKEGKEKSSGCKTTEERIKLSEEPDETETIDSTLLTRVAQTEIVKDETKIYPNPSSGLVFVESKEPLQISILNAEGKVVKEETTSSATTELKLNDLSTGIYYLNYILKGKSESRKVVMINQ